MALASANAPTRTILLAGSGAFEQAYITMTQGVYVGDHPDCAGQIEGLWDLIGSRDNERVPEASSAQYTHEVGQRACAQNAVA